MPRTGPTWDPAQYLRHSGHRTRPFLDLLARLPEPDREDPEVVDLGCGAGNLTALLAARWPAARVTGLDSSPDMLERARREHAGPTPGGGRLDLAEADATTWRPTAPLDVLVSNAALQWVPGHADRFAEWTSALAPGGTFAFQVPANFGAPSHVLMREIAESPRYRPHLDGVLRHADAVLEPAAYLERLLALGLESDVWETTYLHVLKGPDPVLDWVKGTGLRPVLDALGTRPDLREDFLTTYREALRTAYPATERGTVLPFRRLFAVAHRPKETP